MGIKQQKELRNDLRKGERESGHRTHCGQVTHGRWAASPVVAAHLLVSWSLIGRKAGDGSGVHLSLLRVFGNLFLTPCSYFHLIHFFFIFVLLLLLTT